MESNFIPSYQAPVNGHTPGDRIPFHKLDRQAQDRRMREERASVPAQDLLQFMRAWGQLTRDYMHVGYRVSGQIIGVPEQFRVEPAGFGGFTVETVSADGMHVLPATAEQLLELDDSIRGGQVQIVLQRRWATNVDSESPIRVLHQARGHFTPITATLLMPTTEELRAGGR